MTLNLHVQYFQPPHLSSAEVEVDPLDQEAAVEVNQTLNYDYSVVAAELLD